MNIFLKKDKNTYFLGIHYRGTDKIIEHNALEQTS